MYQVFLPSYCGSISNFVDSKFSIFKKPNIHYSVVSLERTQGKRKAGARFPKNPRELDRENALEKTLHSKLLRLVRDDKTTTRRCKSDKEGQDWEFYIFKKPNIHYSVVSLERTQGKRKAGARFPKNPRELDRENALEKTLHSKLLRLVRDDKTTTRRCKSDKEGQDWAGSILTKPIIVV